MKNILITGGAKGIGKAVAEAFTDKGDSVIIVDKDEKEGRNTCAQIRGKGGKIDFLLTDISIPGNVPRMVIEAVRLLGKIDILINNAGFGIWKSPVDLTVEEWDSVINTNLRGTFLCSRETAKIMRNSGGGSIINIASTRAFMSEPDFDAYAASKGGIISLTHSLAASLSPFNIKVNCISPGWIETKDYEKLRESDHKQHLSGRVGKPEDVAKACIFIAENDFINGENLIIDGGMTRKMIYLP